MQKNIFLYDEGIDGFPEIISYLKNLGLTFNVRKNLIEPREDIALSFAKSKVIDITKDIENQPLKAEIDYEKKRLELKEKSSLIYDGFRLQGLFRSLIPKEQTNLKYGNIIFIKELIATFEERDKRYHLRVGLYGFPSIISVGGVVSAPARPREYYIKKRLGIEEAVLKKEFEGRFIEDNSPFIPEILKGYALQAIFFYLTGSPHCPDPNCRLYNAHWQEEMINSQLISGKLCKRHQSFLSNLNVYS